MSSAHAYTTYLTYAYQSAYVAGLADTALLVDGNFGQGFTAGYVKGLSADIQQRIISFTNDTLNNYGPCSNAGASYNAATESFDFSGVTEAQKRPCFDYLSKGIYAIAGAGTAGSAAVIGTPVIRATSFAQMQTISKAIGSRGQSRGNAGINRVAFGGEKAATGLAAGGVPSKSSVWFSYDGTDLKNTNPGTQAKTGVDNFVGGFDYQMSDRLTVGISLAKDYTKVDAKYLNNAKIDIDGITLAPYVGYQLDQNWSVDAAIGLGSGKMDTAERGTPISSLKFDRSFLGANATYTRWIDQLQVNGRISYMNAAEKFSSSGDFTGFTNRAEQIRLGAQVGYSMASMMPYVGLTQISDINVKAKNADNYAYNLDVGVNIFGKNGMVGGIAYSEEFSRQYQKKQSWTANLSIRF
ncbi:MAG: autotransporter outer membrane beta-barrel domain-containing protein [Rhodocyclaceae bacterium]|nr:autotransporter outer membrane beta-barrel domain-containing protein [Rhodocyclaceae bacterium]